MKSSMYSYKIELFETTCEILPKFGTGYPDTRDKLCPIKYKQTDEIEHDPKRHTVVCPDGSGNACEDSIACPDYSGWPLKIKL
ncbi:hypothetical protein SAMN04488104_1015100 [Algoriphagus faecimaris]|uniref:Uncharacterized protein n=1 Tax=Algoriphagus faecimaris TaxID=686796 RepID=A0A1G6S6N7_9BACT|nr:hypothetical protein [Algoriphagus faecimaris]SDD12351.1 hypothetical protein SAMN04488104_1015100 [Algoriphagus faecimaris]